MIYPLFLEMRQSQLTALTRLPKLGSEPWNFFSMPGIFKPNPPDWRQEQRKWP